MFAIAALALPAAQAAEVTLSWESPDDDRVDGYHIYWGPESYSPDPNQPDTTINDPDTRNYTITGLSPSTDYQVAATSFDSDTDPETISAFSETVYFTTAAETSDGSTDDGSTGDTSDGSTDTGDTGDTLDSGDFADQYHAVGFFHNGDFGTETLA